MISNNNYLENYQKKSYNYELLIQDITKKEEFQNSYQATILKISDIKYKNTYFNINNQDSNINRDIIIKVPNMYKLQIWDIITTNTKLYLFQNTPDFAYKSYMNSKNIYASSNLNSVNIIDYQELFILKKYAISLREDLLDIIYEIYPKNEAIFLWWILLWARESLSEDIKNDFNRSWLTHFIAVSWFNITILIIFVSYSLKFFPQIIQVIWITLFIIFFVLLVGDTAPVIRAAIMWLIWYFILVSGRNTHSYTLITLTWAIMIFLYPQSLNYDVSLHLSFLAVIWIIFTQNFYKKIFNKAPEFLAIKEALILTFAALTFTLPLMLFNFWQVSILSPIANISVTWTIPIAMLLGFISLIVYIVSPILWELSGYLAWVLLKYDMNMVHFFWSQDFAVFEYDFWEYKSYFLTLYFMVSIFFLLYFNGNKKEVTV
jgi:competence protein ComEC